LGADFNFLTGADMIPTIHQTDKLLYAQIYEFYRDAILHERLSPGYKIPSHRKLAKELGVSNNTVVRAYEQLIHEGYVKNEHRRGLFVTALESREWQVRHVLKKKYASSAPSARKNIKADFSPSDQLVDEKNFPIKQWRKCSNWALDGISFQYQEYEREDPLKGPLLKYLLEHRGVHATPEQLIIGSGATTLIFWLAFVLRKTHSSIIFEEPCYPRPRFLFSELGYDIRPVTLTQDGIDLRKLSKVKTDLIYVTPSHQYPTGAAIPVANRIQILNWARKNNAYIIEDDFDCEFRYKMKLMPSLQGLDKFDRVIYVGSFSNSLMPSLRVAYLVLPENFSVSYHQYSHLVNTVPFIIRKTLAYFIAEGFWERHLKKMRSIYQKKYDVCIEALNKLPGNCIHFNNTASGLNILLRLRTRLSEQELIKRALKSGISISSVNEFYFKKRNQPSQPEVLLEFGNLPVQEIEVIVKKLYKAWFT
jgi:GntR family transcriptional regulator/MocR family aminotransferase